MDKIKIGKEVLEIMNDMYYKVLPKDNEPETLIAKSELGASIRTIKEIIKQEERAKQEKEN